MKFRISYFAKPSAPGAVPALLAAPTGDFNTVDDARKAAIADADKIGAADSIIIDPIGERWVKGERLVKTDSGWERVPELRALSCPPRRFPPPWCATAPS
jgi:hypothetical protein